MTHVLDDLPTCNMASRRQRFRSFTLLELLVILGIMGILVAVLLPAW